MFEGPRRYADDNEEGGIDEPFDYFENAKKQREEREAEEATKKAERVAKEAEKEAEKKARVTKKLADKAQEKLEKKADKLESTSTEAKVEIAVAQKEVSELQKALDATAGELPSPVEMKFTDGSEYTANLEEGEEAIFDISHSIDKVTENVAVADEATEQADALVRARAALESVGASHIDMTYEGQENDTALFGETGPQDDVRNKLRRSWDVSGGVDPGEAIDTTELGEPGPISFADAIHTVPSASALETSSSTSDWGGASAEAYAPASHTFTAETAPATTVDTASSSSKFASGFRSGKTFLGGLLAGRAISTKNKLEKVNQALTFETKDLQREIKLTQVTPTAMRETSLPGASAQSAPNMLPTPSPYEIRGTNEPAIPSWISQINGEVEKGRVPELKKWQLDVLRAQHPELLKKYQKLDGRAKEIIKLQSRETLKGAGNLLGKSQASSPIPGAQLPAPVYSLPAYMKPEQQPSYANTNSSSAAYELAMGGSASNGSVFSTQYLTIVAIGGVLFGAALIVAFGL